MSNYTTFVLQFWFLLFTSVFAPNLKIYVFTRNEFLQVNYVNYPPGSDIVLEESAFCGMLKENVPSNLPIYEASFVIFFCVPLGVLLLLYTLIGLEIRSTGLHDSINGTVHGETKKMQSRKSIIRMLGKLYM